MTTVFSGVMSVGSAVSGSVVLTPSLISVGRAEAGMPTLKRAAAPSETVGLLTVRRPRSSSDGGGGPGGPGGGGGGSSRPSSTMALATVPWVIEAPLALDRLTEKVSDCSNTSSLLIATVMVWVSG